MRDLNHFPSVSHPIDHTSIDHRWVGEGEKLVRALFQAASQKAPSIIFIDEVWKGAHH